MTAVAKRRKPLDKALQEAVVKWMPLGVRAARRSLGGRPLQSADYDDLVQDAWLQMCVSAGLFDGARGVAIQTKMGGDAALAMRTAYYARLRRGFSGLGAVANVGELMAKVPGEADYDDVGPHAVAGRDPADGADAASDRAAVWAAVAGLPKRQRMVLTYRYREGLSLDETAVRLGVSRATAGNDEGAAIRTLREVLHATALDA